jgi:PEP-CTERM motif
MLRNMFLTGLALLAVAATSQAAIISDNGVATPGLAGFKTFTVSVQSDEPVTAVNFVGDGSNDAGSGFGFFGAMNQRNPFGLPSIFTDNNGVMVPAGFDQAQDSQFRVNSTTVVVPPNLAEEGANVLQAAWAWSTPQTAVPPLAIAQIVIPDAAAGQVSYRGQITVLRGGANVDLPVEMGILGGVPAPDIQLVNLGEIESGAVIMAQLNATNGPNTWSNLVPTMGSPALAATLGADGKFSWDPTGSARGAKGSGNVMYSWSATATNAGGFDTDVAITLKLIPEPATLSLVGLAVIGFVGLARRRS